ncbi:MAG: hypothetical protein RIR12_1732 [Bacteroidota bacterium]|jgi:hypothetical protein
MSEGGYKIRNQSLPHFITFAVCEWVDVFTRKLYRDILLDSVRYFFRPTSPQLYVVFFVFYKKNKTIGKL